MTTATELSGVMTQLGEALTRRRDLRAFLVGELGDVRKIELDNDVATIRLPVVSFSVANYDEEQRRYEAPIRYGAQSFERVGYLSNGVILYGAAGCRFQKWIYERNYALETIREESAEALLAHQLQWWLGRLHGAAKVSLIERLDYSGGHVRHTVEGVGRAHL